MAFIEVNNLVKEYKIIEKEKGIKGYLKHLIKPKYKILKAVKDKNSEWIINEIKEEKEYTNKKPKTKKSQIEKFNNKYKSS